MKRSVAGVLLLFTVAFAFAQEPTKKIFLPKSSRAAAYILKLQSNEDLVQIVRSEPVYIAMLERAGLDAKWRQEAIEGLAKLHGSDPLTELISSIGRVAKATDESAQSVLREQAKILLSHDKQQLASNAESLGALVGNANPLASQVALAAIVTYEGSAEAVATSHPKSIANLLLSTELLHGPIQNSLFAIAQANWSSSDEVVRQAAMTAASFLTGNEAQTLTRLNGAIVVAADTATAVEAFERMPLENWPEDQASQIATSLVEFVRSTPTAERTVGTPSRATALLQQLVPRLPKAVAIEIKSGLDGLSVEQFPIRAPYERMAFEPDVLVVPADRAMEIVFSNDDDKPHNFLLTEPGKFEDVGLAAQAMATTPEGQAKFFVPDEGVLHASTMVWPEKVERISFQSPKQPGVYPFVCTFPGHWLKMYGAMVVVDDVAAYKSETNPLPTADELLGKKTVKQWKYDDLSEDAAKLDSAPRSFENGRRLFAKVSCVACHKIGQDSLLSKNIGPELTKISEKYKKPEEVLREIIEPSRQIEEKYASVVVVDSDGQVIRGVIVQRSDTELVLKENPLVNCDPITVNIEDIDEEEKSTLSPMPEGLLNTLYRDEILDLLAYIVAGGDEHHRLFAR